MTDTRQHDRSHHTVYIVDDDPAVLDAILTVIQDLEFCPKGFGDPQDFMASISSADTGCLILDLHMPQLDGLQVLRLLEARNCHLPTILITGDIEAAASIRARVKGLVTVLEKPLDPRALIASIRIAMRSGPSN